MYADYKNKKQMPRPVKPPYKGKLATNTPQGRTRPNFQKHKEADGAYESQGFYIYSDGSFLDPDGYQFDKWGYDELGGHYDDNNIYHPPQQMSELVEPKTTAKHATRPINDERKRHDT